MTFCVYCCGSQPPEVDGIQSTIGQSTKCLLGLARYPFRESRTSLETNEVGEPGGRGFAKHNRNSNSAWKIRYRRLLLNVPNWAWETWWYYIACCHLGHQRIHCRFSGWEGSRIHQSSNVEFDVCVKCDVHEPIVAFGRREIQGIWKTKLVWR
jgi:hypothetical protein